MKTLDEIKDEVTLNNGYWSYKLAVLAFKEGNMKTEVFNLIVNQIGREVAKEALNNASENFLGASDFARDTRESILNESNIPKL